MIEPSDPLLFRVVSRFLAAKATHNGASKYAFVWNQPAPRCQIPDDITVECSQGCMLTAREIERMLPARLKVAPRSCRIEHVLANAETNRTRFEAATTDGKRITGTITVNIVASERRVDAFSVVDLDS